MPAPSITHAYVSATFSGVSSMQVAFTSSVSAGDTLISGMAQSQSTRRGITSWTDNLSQTHTAIGSGAEQAGNHTEAPRYKENTAALVASDNISVTLDGGSSGRLHAIAISPSTYGSLQDNRVNGSAATSHQCAATGFTTDANVFIVGLSTLDGGGGSIVTGDAYSKHGTSTEQMFFTKASDSALGSTQVGPYTSEISRTDTGVLAAFYAAGGGGVFIVSNMNIG